MSTHRPCGDTPGTPACPWRKDAPPGYWDRSHFENIARECRGDGMTTMLCHKSTKERPIICAGWAAVVGFDSIGLRLAAISKRYDPEKLNIEGLTLYRSMDEMIRANNKVYVSQGQKPVRL